MNSGVVYKGSPPERLKAQGTLTFVIDSGSFKTFAVDLDLRVVKKHGWTTGLQDTSRGCLGQNMADELTVERHDRFHRFWGLCPEPLTQRALISTLGQTHHFHQDLIGAHAFHVGQGRGSRGEADRHLGDDGTIPTSPRCSIRARLNQRSTKPRFGRAEQLLEKRKSRSSGLALDRAEVDIRRKARLNSLGLGRFELDLTVLDQADVVIAGVRTCKHCHEQGVFVVHAFEDLLVRCYTKRQLACAGGA